MNARWTGIFYLMIVCALPLAADEPRHGVLRVQFVRGPEKGPLTVRITRTGEHDPIAVRTAGPRDNAITFDRLAGGRYELLVEGDEPLKRLATIAFVEAGQTRQVKLELPHGVVYGRFTLGGIPFRTEVTLMHDEESWTTKLRTADDGTYSSVVWRRGEFDVAVSGRGIETTTVGTLTIPDGIVPRIDFDVPDRQVTGRVTTADGAPSGGVVLALETTTPASRRVARRRTDANGEFLFFGVQAGAQSLRVAAVERHLRPDAIRFDLAADDTRHDVAIVLKEGLDRRVTIVDHHDAPRAGATVLCVTGGEIRSTATTDAKGATTIATPAGEASTLYVLPHEGSLALHHIDGKNTGQNAIRIRVPPANSAIDLVAKVTDGTALRDVAFMMRFNGDIIPPEVVREMQRHQGVRLLTDENGLARLPNVPPGFYEFWPVRSDEEIEAILETAGIIDPPIGFNARVGENRVMVRFARRH